MLVEDMQARNITLVQNIDDVGEFNREYRKDYTYYFIKWTRNYADTLFGSYGVHLNDEVHFVGDL